MRRRWTPALAAPALVVTLPLTGFAFQNEERRLFVRAAREFGSDPVTVARFSYDTAGLFLRARNFRPLGRFVEQAEHAFAAEFMLDRYGRLFCDGPGREEELLSDPPTDWDWTSRG